MSVYIKSSGYISIAILEVTPEDCHINSGYFTWDPRDGSQWCSCYHGYGGKHCQTRKNNVNYVYVWCDPGCCSGRYQGDTSWVIK